MFTPTWLCRYLILLTAPPCLLLQVRGAYSRLNQAKARIAQRTAQGQWGTVTGDDDVREVPVEDLEPLSRGIDELDRRHRKGIADFTQKLPSQVWRVVCVWERRLALMQLCYP